ncbi:MAG TPA: cyanophycin synthetase [Gemmatimonadaceae bacterium]|nr:cyanophycin synthetase [Gemmatimonadaceae bacterium]
MHHPAGGAAVAGVLNADDLRVSRLRALRGPNYWRLAPVIACDVTLGSLEHITSADVDGFPDRLTSVLPTLYEHTCSRDQPGGFVERLREGTYLPHILEHVALELQSLAGSDVGFGRVVESGDVGVWWVIVAYEEEDVGLQSVRDGARIIRACLTGEEIDVDHIVGELHELYEEVRLGPSTAAIVEEARRRDIPVRRLNSRSLIQLGLGRNLRRIQATMTDYTSTIAAEIAQDKSDTKRVLGNVGLPVPMGEVASTVDDAIAIAREIGFPVILKPHDASQGRGISGRLDDEEAVREAWNATAEVSKRVVVEHFATGRDHRVLVVDGKMVAVAERVPAHVIGDGRSSVRDLIRAENEDPRRGVGHRKTLTRLPTDARTEEYLAQCALTMDSVPAEGVRVNLRPTANLSTGGTSIDRTDEIHPDNVTACEMAAGVVGLDVAGIDVLTEDISVPFRDNDAVIVEVNAAPGIRMHTHPTEGKARNVAAPIIDMLYPPGKDPTIPIIAVTGTNGKTTTVRLIAHLFRHTDRAVGFTTTDGVYLGNRLVMEGDMTGPFSANIILSNPAVDVAVLETARGGILRAGLGFDECDVGIILNVASDHLGMRGIHTLEQLADVKSVIASVVKRDGHAVLNADDRLVLAMRERTPGDLVLFSTAPEGENEEFEEHLSRNGIAARIENGTFVLRRGRLRIPIADEREVPLMLGGAAKFQRGNILAAIVAAYVQGVRYDDIRAGLLSFFPSPSMTPGRLNVIRIDGARVLIDYAHNLAAVTGLVELAMALPATRRIAVITAPGDRRDEDIQAVASSFGSFDRIILKEDTDLRGRQPGDVIALQRDALNEMGVSDDRIDVVRDELEAVRHALDRLEPGDLALILVDDVPAVLAAVRPYTGGSVNI